MKRRTATAVGAVIALLAGLLVAIAPVTAPAAEAATGTDFDPGFIISDETFYNSTAMSAGDVQAFLQAKGAGCTASSLPCVKDLVLTWEGRAGDQYCSTLAGGSGRAADYFVAVALACGINPQVLLVLVEKEQSLVSRSSPTDWSYRYATGFACPDSSGCSSATAGFATQVYLAAKQFQRYRINPGSYNYRAGQNNPILYHPNTACGSSSVYIRNQATAGLYNYTPYQPNSAALTALYGLGDGCSSYGNRNFWRMFTDWFGQPANMLTAASFEGSIDRWGFVNGVLSRQLVGPTDSGPKSGRHFLALYTWGSGRSLSQDVRVTPQVGQEVTASIWVKSATPGHPYSGVLAVWGLGGSLELAATPFTVGEEWTEVTTSMTVRNPGHSTLRVEIYLNSTDAILWLDATSLVRSSTPTPVAPLELSAGDFESGQGTWGQRNGSTTVGVADVADAAHGGTHVLSARAASVGSSVGVDAARYALPGESYTATVWMRSASETPVEGALALWGLGSSPLLATTGFTADATWRPVQVTLPVTRSGVSSLRVEVYFGTAGVDLWLDDATLTPNLLPNGSFDAGVGGWNNGIVHNALDPAANGGPYGSGVDGAAFAVLTPRALGGSVASDVARTIAAGETYTASIWVRSGDPARAYPAALAVWALGGAQELFVVDFTAGAEWTRVDLPITIANAGHHAFRFEIYPGGAADQVLLLDAAGLH